MAKTYRVSGTFLMGERWAHFSTDVQTDSQDRAREKILSEYGSRHRVTRRLIRIEKVEEVKAEERGPGR